MITLLARLLRDTGHVDQAAPLLTDVLRRYPPEQNRRNGLIHIDIALNAAACGHLDHAVDNGLTAAHSHVLDSGKGLSRLSRLHRTLAQRPATATTELRDRLGSILRNT